MLNEKQYKDAQKMAIGYFEKAGITLTQKEKDNIEVADFGFGDLAKIGLEILVYVNTKKVCAKEMIMFPGQTCPEHIHKSTKLISGKEETFRCRWGKVYLYVPGEKSATIKDEGLEEYSQHFTVFNEIVLDKGEQYTMMPDTLHWFRAGDNGAVVSEFSTTSTDEQDVFTGPRINRFTKIEGEVV